MPMARHVLQKRQKNSDGHKSGPDSAKDCDGLVCFI
jgi:hypothetical protein